MRNLLFFTLSLILFACNSTTNKKQLPILGNKDVVVNMLNGEEQIDTIYHEIEAFAFYNQDSALISDKDTEGKVYVADFFFTTCPTICPIMKSNMLDVYEKFLEESRFLILSHSIDPKHDSVATLKAYAQKLDISSKRWNLLTGEKSEIYEMAKNYMISAAEDANAPGGYMHSGAFILIDKNKHIRGYYDGTNKEEVKKLIDDIEWLLQNEK